MRQNWRHYGSVAASKAMHSSRMVGTGTMKALRATGSGIKKVTKATGRGIVKTGKAIGNGAKRIGSAVSGKDYRDLKKARQNIADKDHKINRMNEDIDYLKGKARQGFDERNSEEKAKDKMTDNFRKEQRDHYDTKTDLQREKVSHNVTKAGKEKAEKEARQEKHLREGYEEEAKTLRDKRANDLKKGRL